MLRNVSIGGQGGKLNNNIRCIEMKLVFIQMKKDGVE